MVQGGIIRLLSRGARVTCHAARRITAEGEWLRLVTVPLPAMYGGLFHT